LAAIAKRGVHGVADDERHYKLHIVLRQQT